MTPTLRERFASALNPRSSILTPLAALAFAWLLKRHYSHASAEDLRWILAPTTWLTSLFVSGEFAFQAGQGYLSREQSVLISPACAGVNFMVVALLSLVLGYSSNFAGLRQRAHWLAVSLGLAYVTTLVVNALRIGLSIALGHLATRVTGLTFQSVHRLLGIFIYLAGLMSLCLTVQLWLSSRGVRPAKPGQARRNQAPLVALGLYLTVTLLVPLLGGAANNPDYWSHAAPVSVLVVVSVALLFAARGRTWDDGRHAFRSPEHPERVATEPGSRG
jgi:exosortase K